MRALCLALVFAAATGLVPATAVADDEPITITFSHFLGPDSFFQNDVVEPFAKELEERTGGRVEVVTYANDSEWGGVRDQATNVENGDVDIALGLRGAEGDRFPGTSVIELPFLVPDAKAGSLALWELHASGGLGEEYDDFKVLALFVHDPGLVHTTERPVSSPKDMTGLSLRSPNRTVSAALEHLGAVPVVLQVDEVMNAVGDGRI
ncbi:MAG: TRAP transporter substrate-binding protein DctP, partial [Pseudomonadota bacterium]